MFLLASGANYSERLFGFSIQSSRRGVEIISQIVQVDAEAEIGNAILRQMKFLLSVIL